MATQFSDTQFTPSQRRFSMPSWRRVIAGAACASIALVGATVAPGAAQDVVTADPAPAGDAATENQPGSVTQDGAVVTVSVTSGEAENSVRIALPNGSAMTTTATTGTSVSIQVPEDSSAGVGTAFVNDISVGTFMVGDGSATDNTTVADTPAAVATDAVVADATAAVATDAVAADSTVAVAADVATDATAAVATDATAAVTADAVTAEASAVEAVVVEHDGAVYGFTDGIPATDAAVFDAGATASSSSAATTAAAPSALATTGVTNAVPMAFGLGLFAIGAAVIATIRREQEWQSRFAPSWLK